METKVKWKVNNLVNQNNQNNYKNKSEKDHLLYMKTQEWTVVDCQWSICHY